jgi:hypothetical protein
MNAIAFGVLCVALLLQGDYAKGDYCPYPTCHRWDQLAYDSTMKLNCDFDAKAQTSSNALIDACSDSPAKISWFRAFSWYRLQFEIPRYASTGQSLPNGQDYAFAESNCKQKPATASTYPQQATAVIRSPAFNPSGCQTFRLSFWYLLSAQPVVSQDIMRRFGLEVFVHYSSEGNSLPTERIWGSSSDYNSFAGANRWTKAEVEFSVSSGRQFTLNFFAHHNDNCARNFQRILLDSISTLTAAPGVCPVATTPRPLFITQRPTIRTTPRPVPTNNPWNPWNSQSSQQCDCEEKKVIISCNQGQHSISEVDPDQSKATSIAFNGDNSARCRILQHDIHSWAMEYSDAQRASNSAVVINCSNGYSTISDLNPSSSEAMSAVFTGDNSFNCRKMLNDLHRYLLQKLN